MQAFTIGLISFYQRRISPYKGYRCAHGAYHDGPSCSEFAKQTVAEKGLYAAILLMRERFALCHRAHAALQLQSARVLAGEKSKDSSPRTKQGDACANVCTMPCL
jgi:uncharacterized protein